MELRTSFHLTTAAAERINYKIKTLKRVAYSYTNEISFQNKILQRCGLLIPPHLRLLQLIYYRPFYRVLLFELKV